MGGIREDRMTVDLTAIEIERRLTAIETTLETTLPTFATKADIQVGESRSPGRAS